MAEIKEHGLLESNIRKAINTFTYQLELKNTPSPAAFQQAMQADLNYWFGHKVSFEQRQMPVYALRLSSPDAKQRFLSKSDSTSLKGDYSGYTLRKINMEQLIAFFYRYQRQVFFDETGLEQPIDLQLNANLTDLTQVKKALAANGFELVEINKPMQVMVIR